MLAFPVAGLLPLDVPGGGAVVRIGSMVVFLPTLIAFLVVCYHRVCLRHIAGGIDRAL